MQKRQIRPFFLMTTFMAMLRSFPQKLTAGDPRAERQKCIVTAIRSQWHALTWVWGGGALLSLPPLSIRVTLSIRGLCELVYVEEGSWCALQCACWIRLL